MSTTTTEIVEKVEQVKVASGFAKRNANKKRIEDEEAELAELMQAREATPQEDNEIDDGPEPEGAEEKTFKKRYGDLRRHSQKKENELQQQIDELRRQLEVSTKKEIQYPKSESELEDWMSQYPDVAKIVETIAMKKVQEQASDYESRFQEIDNMKQEAMRQKAMVELLQAHPDYEEIRDTDDFQFWVDDQPQWIKDALIHNETDAFSAARAIDLYKVDKGISTKKKPNRDKDAASSVSTRSQRSSPESNSSQGYLRESEVDKWSTSEFEKRQEEIAEAMREDKFIYDLRSRGR